MLLEITTLVICWNIVIADIRKKTKFRSRLLLNGVYFECCSNAKYEKLPVISVNGSRRAISVERDVTSGAGNDFGWNLEIEIGPRSENILEGEWDRKGKRPIGVTVLPKVADLSALSNLLQLSIRLLSFRLPNKCDTLLTNASTPSHLETFIIWKPWNLKSMQSSSQGRMNLMCANEHCCDLMLWLQRCHSPWSSLVEWGEGLYLPNCQVNLVIALYILSQLFLSS